MRIESRARARALQALYACEMRGGKNLDRVATQVWDDLAVASPTSQPTGVSNDWARSSDPSFASAPLS